MNSSQPQRNLLFAFQRNLIYPTAPVPLQSCPQASAVLRSVFSPLLRMHPNLWRNSLPSICPRVRSPASPRPQLFCGW